VPKVSRIGNKVVVLPAGVTVDRKDNTVTVKGPKGELTRTFSNNIDIKVEGSEVTFTRPNDTKEMKTIHGTTRANFHNMVVGVSEGFKKDLEMIGVGYRAQLQGKKIVLSLGKSHPDEVEAPEGIEFEVPAATQISVKGANKEIVGEVAAYIRSLRPPEPYKGKGIRYVGEFVRRKEGKTGK
jgi:large subunit ribosomal protein L6